MDKPRIGLEPDLVARLEGMALTKCGDDVDATKLRNDLNLRAGWLDHQNSGVGPVVGNNEMLGARAVDGRLSIAASWRGSNRQPCSTRTFKFHSAIGANGAVEKIHG